MTLLRGPYPGRTAGHSRAPRQARPPAPSATRAARPGGATRRGGKGVARAAATAFAVAALAGAGVTRRAALAASFTLLGHLHWVLILLAIMLESASMAALAGMQRRLLAAGGAIVGARPMLATTYTANALSVSVPLAGPELGMAFTFRRFTRQGADAPLAGWSLLFGGVVAFAGWLIFLWLRHQRPADAKPPARELCHPGPGGPVTAAARWHEDGSRPGR
jgi:hypothetical protein